MLTCYPAKLIWRYVCHGPPLSNERCLAADRQPSYDMHPGPSFSDCRELSGLVIHWMGSFSLADPWNAIRPIYDTVGSTSFTCWGMHTFLNQVRA